MKRSYPYAGPAAAAGGQQGQQQAQPDYSAYGYGATPHASGSNNNDAQQAQWHQQWQQYYAQQAAAAASAAGSGGVQANVAGPAQPYAYNAAPSSYNSYAPQQPQPGPSSSSPFGYGGAQSHAAAAAAAAAAAYNGSAAQYGSPMLGQHVAGSAPMNAGHHNYNGGPASKRARMDGFGGGAVNPAYGQPAYAGGMAAQPMNQSQPRQGAWQGQQRTPSGSNQPIRPMSKHPIPGRPQVMHTSGAGGGGGGGPSNMLASMAAAGIPPRPQGTNARSRRGGQQHSGKFNGPQGVNALGPVSNANRAGFTQHASRNQSGRRVNSSAGSSNNPRGEGRQQSGQQMKGNAGIPRGPAGAKSGADAYEMSRPALLQGRTFTPLDHPVPITAKRTFADFRIKQIEVEQIDWQWLREDLQESEDEEDELDEGDQNTFDSSVVDTNEAPSVDAKGAEEKTERVAQVKKRRDSSGRDTTKARIAFAANPPPPNAPTGPKALSKPVEAETQTSVEDLEDATAGENKVSKSSEDDGGQKAEKEKTEAIEPDSESKAKEGLAWSAFSRGPPHVSANRVTISYASSRRRILIDSEVIKSIEINRAQGTLRIVVNVTTGADHKDNTEAAGENKKRGEEWLVAKGVLLEARNGDATNFTAVTRHQLEHAWHQKAAMQEDEVVSHVDKMIEAADTVEQLQAGGVESAAVEGDEVAEVEVAKESGEGEGEEESNHPKTEEADQTNEKQVGFDDHHSLPPFHRLLSKDNEGAGATSSFLQEASAREMSFTLWLDDTSAESKWLKTGSLIEWLSALPGVQTSLSVGPMQTWAGKIYVVDPDPAPTFDETLQAWIKRSNVGTALTRRQFVQERPLTGAESCSEILARIVSIENVAGATSTNDRMSSPSPSHPLSARDVVGELSTTLSGATFDAHHNHVSLGVLTIATMARQYAIASGVTEEELAARLTGVLMAMPLLSLFNALDSMCKEVLDKERIAQAKARRVNGIANGTKTAVKDESGVAMRSERGVGMSNDEASFSAEAENLEGEEDEDEAQETTSKDEAAEAGSGQQIKLEVDDDEREAIAEVKQDEDVSTSNSSIVKQEAAE